MERSGGGGTPAAPGASSPEVTYSQAVQLYDRKEYEEAFAAFLALAEAGDRSACCFVGYLHAEGLGCAPDAARAAAWYGRGALAGDRQSQRFLAGALVSGEGTVRDLPSAFHWMRRAALQVDTVALNDLAGYYATGTGVERDMAEAYYWCALSARRGNPRAVRDLMVRVGFRMTDEELLRGHQLLWMNATPPVSDERFFAVVRALVRKRLRMAELETESRKRDSEWAFTHKMEGECYAEALWIFVRAVDNLDPRGVGESPGTAATSGDQQNGGAA